MRRLAVTLLVAAAVAAPAIAPAQLPLPKPENLKVLPADIPVRALLDTMGTFARALGVRCAYCHVERQGDPRVHFDFASDQKVEKRKAREMLRMVAAINGEYLAKLPSRQEPRITVSCFTCHHGVTEPRPLQQVVLAAYDAGGADSAEAAYDALRQRYYGRAAYDFGDVPLADVAGTLRARGKVADALRLYLLNTRLFPNSAFAFLRASEGQLAAGDTAAAVSSLEKAVAMDPNDPQARGMLERLKKP